MKQPVSHADAGLAHFFSFLACTYYQNSTYYSNSRY